MTLPDSNVQVSRKIATRTTLPPEMRFVESKRRKLQRPFWSCTPERITVYAPGARVAAECGFFVICRGEAGCGQFGNSIAIRPVVVGADRFAGRVVKRDRRISQGANDAEKT